jgi:hypothetical protein
MKRYSQRTQRYERLNAATNYDLNGQELPLREANNSTRVHDSKFATTETLSADAESNNTSWYQPRSLIVRLRQTLEGKLWKSGLYAGLYASFAVLVSNIVLLFTGIFGVIDGLGTIAIRDMNRVSRESTAYHVLVNVLSSVLLTSSNFAMQVLCAPTRDEIDQAHRNGQWLEIGIMSTHNLRLVARKRGYVWALLAISSAPLHLLLDLTRNA